MVGRREGDLVGSGFVRSPWQHRIDFLNCFAPLRNSQLRLLVTRIGDEIADDADSITFVTGFQPGLGGLLALAAGRSAHTGADRMSMCVNDTACERMVAGGLITVARQLVSVCVRLVAI